MLYECDETNCNVGKARCMNRAFQDLQQRTKKGGRYRVGVEVVKTSDRGYGVRSNRCFEANQIIMEYTGEIITEEECERRMNEVYKDNEVSASIVSQSGCMGMLLHRTQKQPKHVELTQSSVLLPHVVRPEHDY